MNQINLSRVRSVYSLSIVSLIFILLSLAGILYLAFAGGNLNYLEQSSGFLFNLIWHPQNAESYFNHLVKNQTALINFSVLLLSYLIVFFGWIFFPTIAAIRASKVIDIKGYSRTAIFTTPAVLIWLVFAPLVWLISIIMLISKSFSYIKKGANIPNKNNKNLLSKKEFNMPNKDEYEDDDNRHRRQRERNDRYDDRRDSYYDEKSYCYENKRERNDRYSKYDDYRESRR